MENRRWCSFSPGASARRKHLKKPKESTPAADQTVRCRPLRASRTQCRSPRRDKGTMVVSLEPAARREAAEGTGALFVFSLAAGFCCQPLDGLLYLSGVGPVDERLQLFRRQLLPLRQPVKRIQQDRAQRQHLGQHDLLSGPRLPPVHLAQENLADPFAD